MRNLNQTILSAVDTASVNGAAVDSNQLVSASFQSVFGDVTAAGTVKIQASNDVPVSSRQSFTPTNWSDIPSATATVTAGVAPLIVIANMSFGYIRAVYTRTGGGTTTIIVNIDALGI